MVRDPHRLRLSTRRLKQGFAAGGMGVRIILRSSKSWQHMSAVGHFPPIQVVLKAGPCPFRPESGHEARGR